MFRMPRLSHLALAVAVMASPLAAQNSGFESTDAAEGDAVIEAPTVQMPAHQQSASRQPASAPVASPEWASPPAQPRPSEARAANASPPQCIAAMQRLTQLQSQEEVLWSSQTEAAELYRVWSSSTCVSARRGSSNIKQDLANAMLLLQSNGTDLEADLQSETARCEGAAAAKWSSENADFKRQHSRSDLAATCMLNMRLTLYGKALNRLNQSNANSYANAQAEYEAAQQARLDQIAADKAAYAAERAEWERRSKLCRKGKREYCAAE